MSNFCRKATRLCFYPLLLLLVWLLVKPEAQTPPTPSHKRLKTEAFAQVMAFGASPCFNALALICYSTAPALSRTVLDAPRKSVGWNSIADCAVALVALGEFRCPVASSAVVGKRQKKSRFPVAQTKESGFGCPWAMVGLNGLSGVNFQLSRRFSQL